MDRRTSISAYNYNLGDEAKPEHIDLTKTNHYAAYEVKKLDVGDSVFVKTSNNKWCFAKLIEKSTDGDGNFYIYQIGQNQIFDCREGRLGDCVRLVEVVNQNPYAKLDINQSSSCESYTDRVVRSNYQKKRSSHTGIIDSKSNDSGDGDDKENVPHTNNCSEATRSVAISELSMASPVENVLKERRSLGAIQLGDIKSTSSRIGEPHIPKSISTRKDPDEAGSRQSKAESLSLRGLSTKQQLSSPLAHLNCIEEQHEEEVSHILDDLLESETLMKEDQSKHRIQPTYQSSVRSTHRSSLPASSSKRNHQVGRTTRRQSFVVKSQNNYQSRIDENVKRRTVNSNGRSTNKAFEKEETVAVDTAQPKSSNFNGKIWTAKSDPEIIFTPSGEVKETGKLDTCNNFGTANWKATSDPEIVFMPSSEEEDKFDSKMQNFNAANWKAESDPEIVFMPSGEDENNCQDSDKQSVMKTSNENASSTSTSVHSSKQNSSKPTGEQGCVNEQTLPSSGKKQRRNIFSGTTFLPKKFKKKPSSKKNQLNSGKVSDGEGTKAANESHSDNGRQSEPSAYPRVSQANHYTRPNPSAYATSAGFVPNYYPSQNVYYLTDPRLAQAYRDYAQNMMRAQVTQYMYNPYTVHQFEVPSIRPNAIHAEKNGKSKAKYRMTSVGYGVQIGMPSTNYSNIMHINIAKM